LKPGVTKIHRSGEKQKTKDFLEKKQKRTGRRDQTEERKGRKGKNTIPPIRVIHLFRNYSNSLFFVEQIILDIMKNPIKSSLSKFFWGREERLGIME
jgi:hypothetical protein